MRVKRHQNQEIYVFVFFTHVDIQHVLLRTPTTPYTFLLGAEDFSSRGAAEYSYYDNLYPCRLNSIKT